MAKSRASSSTPQQTEDVDVKKVEDASSSSPSTPVKPSSKSSNGTSSNNTTTPKRKLLFTVKPPDFRPIPTQYPLEILWARLAVRDFMFRFDKVDTLPKSHYFTLNDAGGVWDDRLYKVIILSLFKILYYDKTSSSDQSSSGSGGSVNNELVPYDIQREYRRSIEKIRGNSPLMFAYLDAFLYKSGTSPCMVTPVSEQFGVVPVAQAEENNNKPQEQKTNGSSSSSQRRLSRMEKRNNFKNQKHSKQEDSDSEEEEENDDDEEEDDDDGVPPVCPLPYTSFGNEEYDREYRHLNILLTFISLVSQTETIRSNVSSSITETTRSAAKTLSNEISKIIASFDKKLQDIRTERKTILSKDYVNDTGLPKKKLLSELTNRELDLRQWKTRRITAAKFNQFLTLRKYSSSRTSPLGMDLFGNTYWHFQQKTKDLTDWGSWIVVERSTSVVYSFGLVQVSSNNNNTNKTTNDNETTTPIKETKEEEEDKEKEEEKEIKPNGNIKLNGNSKKLKANGKTNADSEIEDSDVDIKDEDQKEESEDIDMKDAPEKEATTTNGSSSSSLPSKEDIIEVIDSEGDDESNDKSTKKEENEDQEENDDGDDNDQTPKKTPRKRKNPQEGVSTIKEEYQMPLKKTKRPSAQSLNTNVPYYLYPPPTSTTHKSSHKLTAEFVTMPYFDYDHPTSLPSSNSKVAANVKFDPTVASAKGKLYYMRICKPQIEALRKWLTYQSEVFKHPNTRTKKLLAKNSSWSNTHENLIKYFNQLMTFAPDEDIEADNDNDDE